MYTKDPQVTPTFKPSIEKDIQNNLKHPEQYLKIENQNASDTGFFDQIGTGKRRSLTDDTKSKFSSVGNNIADVNKSDGAPKSSGFSQATTKNTHND